MASCIIKNFNQLIEKDTHLAKFMSLFKILAAIYIYILEYVFLCLMHCKICFSWEHDGR